MRARTRVSRRLNELLRDVRDTVHWTCPLDTYLQLQAVDQGSFGRCRHEIEVSEALSGPGVCG